MLSGDAYLEEDQDIPSNVAALLYQQLEAVEAKQADLLQTSKCLIFLAPHLYSLDEKRGRLPAQQQCSVVQADEGKIAFWRCDIQALHLRSHPSVS